MRNELVNEVIDLLILAGSKDSGVRIKDVQVQTSLSSLSSLSFAEKTIVITVVETFK